MICLYCRFDHAYNGAHGTRELRHFVRQLFPALRGEVVDTGAAPGPRGDPFGRHPALEEHLLQRRVERTFLGVQYIVGSPFDLLSDGVAMGWAPGEGLQDQHLQRPGGDLHARLYVTLHRVSLHSLRPVFMKCNSFLEATYPPAVPAV